VRFDEGICTHGLEAFLVQNCWGRWCLYCEQGMIPVVSSLSTPQGFWKRGGYVRNRREPSSGCDPQCRIWGVSGWSSVLLRSWRVRRITVRA